LRNSQKQHVTISNYKIYINNFANANIKSNNTLSYRNGINTAGSVAKFAD